MGLVLTAECQCGYKKEGLYVGFGMNTPGLDAVPAVCKTCQDIFTLHYTTDSKPRCNNCNSELDFYNSPSLQGNEITENTLSGGFAPEVRYSIYEYAYYYCPQCEEMHLRFHVTMLWD
jgi:hypothetical protein